MKWQKIKLGSLFQIKHGWAFKGEYFSNEGQLIIITPGNFFEKGGFRQLVGKEKFYLGEFPEEFLLKRNDVVIAMTEQGPGLLGSPALIPSDEKYLHNQRIGLIHNVKTDMIDPLFIYRLFFTSIVRNEIFGSATGTKVKHTAPKRIYDIEVPNPPITTQRKIVSILSAYDDLIENNLKRIKLLEEQAFLTYKGVLTIDRLMQISVFDYAHIMSGGTPSTTNPNFWEGEIPFFTPKDLSSQSGYYLNDTERKLTELGLEKCNSKLFPRDTIFITARGTVGKLVLSKIPSAISQSNYAITTRNGSSNYFLFLALIDKVNHFKQLAVGGVFDTIIVDTFKMIFIELPNERIIDQFNIDIKPIFQLIDTLQKQNTKLREARDILLPKLMNGQIEV